MNAEQLATAVKAIDVKPGTIICVTFPAGNSSLENHLHQFLGGYTQEVMDRGGMIVLMPDEMHAGVLTDERIAYLEDFIIQCKTHMAKATT